MVLRESYVDLFMQAYEEQQICYSISGRYYKDAQQKCIIARLMGIIFRNNNPLLDGLLTSVARCALSAELFVSRRHAGVKLIFKVAG